MGRQRVPAHARVADPRLGLAGGPLRRAPAVHARRRRLRRRVGAVRGRADDRVPDRARGRCRASPARCSPPPRWRSSSTVFPESERGAAIGSWTAWGGIGFLIGPLVGGQLVDNASWRWVFAINLPLALITLALARAVRAAGARRGERRGRGSTSPARCSARSALAGISFGLIEQPLRGWSDPARRRAAGRAACSLFAAFIVVRAAHARADAAARAVQAAQLQVANIETFADVRRARAAGLLPRAVPAAGRGLQRARGRRGEPRADAHDVRALAALRRARRPLRPALVHDGRAVPRRRRLPADAAARRRRTSYFGDLLPALLVFSLGLAVTVAPLTATVLADADEHDAGIASAVNNAIARTAGLLATAAVGAVLATSYADRLDARARRPAARARVAGRRSRRRATARSPRSIPRRCRRQDRAVVTEAVQDAGVATFHLAAMIGTGDARRRRAARRGAAAQPQRPTAAERCSGGQFAGVARGGRAGARAGGRMTGSTGC